MITAPRCSILALAALLTGCAAQSAPPTPTSTTARLPTLTALVSSGALEAAPHSRNAPIRLGENGSVLLSDPSATLQLRVVDTLGRVRWQAAPRGEGPGEARMAMPLELTDSSLLAFDLATHRLSEWDSAGTLLRTTPALPRTPLARLGDHRWLGWEPDQPRFGVVEVDAEGHTRPVLDHADAELVALFPAVADARMIVPPALGKWRGGVLVGNGKSYTLALYDSGGRHVRTLHRVLPPNRRSAAQVDAELGALAGRPGARSEHQEARRAQLAAEVRPWFTHVTPLGLDEAGRIWVVGQQGDTTFADVFTDDAFIGRILLPCAGFEGRWALRGHWLALVCAPDDPAFAGDAVVKRWRVG
ncbi:MAG: hypothetical protein ABJC19_07545 [Gemmatimonadota bacterium]